MPDETGEQMPKTPEQEGLSAQVEKPEMKPIAGGAPGWIFKEPEDLKNVTTDELKDELQLLEATPEEILDPESLRNKYLEIAQRVGKKEIEVEEATFVLGRIGEKFRKLEEKRIKAEPEIRKVEFPEKPDEIVDAAFGRLDELEKTAAREKRTFKEVYDKYTAIERAIGEVGENVGEKQDEELNKFLRADHPEGVFLREKLELIFEARRRLHNRALEVEKADGSLAQLGAVRTESPLKPELMVSVTNIRPVDWYVLLNMDTLFPESSETLASNIPVNFALNIWREVGRTGDRRVAIRTKEGWLVMPTFKEARQDEVAMKELRTRIAWLVRKAERKKRKKLGELEKPRSKIIKHAIGRRGEVTRGWERTESIEIDPKEIDEGAKKAEELAYKILTCGLTFARWDRGRWAVTGIQGDRDLMWGEKRRAEFFRHLELRSGGPEPTVGRYFAFEEQDRPLDWKKQEEELKRLEREDPRTFRRLKDWVGDLRKELERRIKVLRDNKKRAIFLYSEKRNPPFGCLIGDFFTTTTIQDAKGTWRRLYDYWETNSRGLRGVPWLKREAFEETLDLLAGKIPKKTKEGIQIEEGVYTGYFTYLLPSAVAIAETMTKTDYKPEELLSPGLWDKLWSGVIRKLSLTSPYLNIRGSLERREILNEFKKNVALGILYDNSYLVQTERKTPWGRLMAKGTLTYNQVFGVSEPGVLDAMKSANYLDEEKLKEIRREAEPWYNPLFRKLS